MTIDYSAMLYDPVYAELGVEAMLTAGASEIGLTVIDDTRPKTNTSGSVEVRSVGPGAYARIPELAGNGITRDDYMDAVLAFNGRTWVVRSYELRGSPNGEDVGEIRFLLKAIVLEDSTVLDWVPADAKIHIDLVGDRAWTEADGEVAIDTLLGSDPNTENGWDVTNYNPSYLTADGYVRPTVDEGPAANPVALIGVARTMFLAGATARMQCLSLSDVDPNFEFALMSTDGADGIEFALGEDFHTSSWGGSFDERILGCRNNGVGAVNAITVTLQGFRAEFAANGLAEPVAGTLDATDRPSGNPLTAVLVDQTAMQVAIQSITLYDPLPDTNGLSELSSHG